MRPRDKILENLEEAYREAFSRASDADDEAEKAELDFRFQRDQLFLEAILDVRALLTERPAERTARATEGDDSGEKKEESLLDKAEKLRRITRLR